MKFEYKTASRENPRFCITSATDGFKYVFPFAVYRLHNPGGIEMLGVMVGRFSFTVAWRKRSR